MLHHQNYIDSPLLQITLGNPRQECRQFGICRIELWDGTLLRGQQCIARAEVGQDQLLLLFLTASLCPRLRQRHFEPYFLVEAPCYLPDFMGLPGCAVLPGCYEVEVGEDRLCVRLRLADAVPNQLTLEYHQAKTSGGGSRCQGCFVDLKGE